MTEDNLAIVEINRAELALEKANDIHEMIQLRDSAAAYEVLANARGFKDAAQKAKIFQLKAERKAGDWLDKNITHEGGRPKQLQDVTDILPDGITKIESHRWQLESKVPEEKFNDWVDDCLATGKEISAAGLQRIANLEKATQSIVALPVNNKPSLHVEFMENVIGGLGKFDLILADPPYNVTNWEWDKIDKFIDKTREWLGLCKQALNDKYNLFWFCSPNYSADIELVFRELQLPIQSRIVWHRRNMTMGSDSKFKFIDTWEMIFHAGNKELNFPDKWGDDRFDVQTIAVPQTNFTDKKYHPTQKPLELIKNLVSIGSFSGERVLDPFAGSGTTAATELDREFVLIEKDVEYANIIRQRFGI